MIVRGVSDAIRRGGQVELHRPARRKRSLDRTLLPDDLFQPTVLVPSALSRCISLSSMPPYFAFQR
jgi:hypothetical protein